MGIKNFFKRILCKHYYTSAVGLGLYGEKKNRPVIQFYPVTKFVCKKCHAEHFYIDVKRPEKKPLRNKIQF